MNLLLNFLLAGVWATITGEFTASNLALGFVLSYLALFLTRRKTKRSGYFRRTVALLNLIVFVAWELVRANLRVARDIISIRIHARPGIVAIPLDARSDAEITVLANLITVTPGTLSIDVSDDRRTLYVHCLFMDDPQALVRDIKGRLERRVLEALR